MTNNDVNISALLGLEVGEATVVVSDAIDYSGLGISLSDSKGILRISDASGVVYANAGWGTNDFSSPDISPNVSLQSAEITLQTDETTGVLSPGLYVIEYKVEVAQQGIFQKTFSSTVTIGSYPEVDIALEVFAATSELVSSDNTGYTIELNGTEVAPTQSTRAHLVVKPYGAGCSAPGSTVDATRTIGPNIWTGVWVSNISTTLLFQVTSWLTIQLVVVGEEHVYASQTLPLSEYFDAIRTLVSRYEGYIASVNRSKAESVKLALDRIQQQFMLYVIAKTSGDTGETYADNIRELLELEAISIPVTGISTEIIPWAAGGVVGGGSTFVFHTGTASPPSNALGNNGDVYYNTSTGYMYKKTGGIWISFAAIPISGGAVASVVSNFFGSQQGGNGAAPFTLGTAIITTSDLAANGDTVVVEAYVKKLTGGSVKLTVNVDGVALFAPYVMTTANQTFDTYHKITAMFVSHASGIGCEITQTIDFGGGTPPSSSTFQSSGHFPIVMPVSSTFNVEIIGENVGPTGGLAADVALTQLTVTKIPAA